jgi:hypothetical protein
VCVYLCVCVFVCVFVCACVNLTVKFVLFVFTISHTVSGAFSKLRKSTISFFVSDSPSFRPSFCLQATTDVLLKVLKLSFIFEYFSIIDREKPSFFKL